MEQNTSNASLGEKEAQGLDTRVDIRVISYRKRKHDPDGISAKAVLDGLVRRGILPDDSTKEVRSITFESIQSEEERTEIVIIPSSIDITAKY